MALSDGNIRAVRDSMQGLNKYDGILSECKMIKNLLDSNGDYYKFCTETGVGARFNDEIESMIDILMKLSNGSKDLVRATNTYLNNQEEINRMARMSGGQGE